MAQNITNDPAFKKKLEQMTPQVPPLSGEVQFPTLDAIAQRTAAQVTPPPLSGEVEFPTLKPLSGEASFPGLNQIGQQGVAEAFPVPDTAFGTGFNPNVTKPVANLGTPAVTPMVGGDGQITSANELSSFMAGLNQQAGLPRTQMPATEMASPESVAGLSITGTPLTQGAITSPQLPQAPQPQVPNITTPAPAAGQLSGMITRDSTGQQFGLNEGGNLRELNPTEGAALQGDLDRRRAAREAQVMQTFGQMTPEQLTEQRQIGAQAQFARLSPAEQANVQAGRPPNVSEAQVGQAQTEAVARQADYEQRQVNNRIDSQMRQWERDNPRATEEATAMHRKQLIEQEGLVQKPDAPDFADKMAERRQAFAEKKHADTMRSKAEKTQAQVDEIVARTKSKYGEGSGKTVSSSEMKNTMKLMEDANIYYDPDSGKWMKRAGFFGKWGDKEIDEDSEEYKIISATKGGELLLKDPELLNPDTEKNESMIEKVMAANPNASREEVIQSLKDAGRM